MNRIDSSTTIMPLPARKGKGKIETEFKSSISVRLDSGRLIKLGKAQLEDLRDLVGNRDDPDIGNITGWMSYWRRSDYFILGPCKEAANEWENHPHSRHLHRPWTTLAEFVELVGIANDLDLIQFADFVRGGKFHEASVVWREWGLRHQGPSPIRIPKPHPKAKRITGEDGEEIVVETGLEYL